MEIRTANLRALKVATAVILLGLGSASLASTQEPSEAQKAKTRAAMIYKPNIEYPYEAKRARLTGHGVVVLDVNPATGEVIAARMAQSTGHALLDQASIQGFREARFRPGTTARQVKIPINFTLVGGGQFYDYVDVKSKNMDDVLAHFLGKGTVLKGPIPAYPRSPAWTDKSGKGVYELHADKDGKVTQVKILKTSADAIFDREAVKTLGKWRLRLGRPLILELPLRFKLTPTNYSVDVGR